MGGVGWAVEEYVCPGLCPNTKTCTKKLLPYIPIIIQDSDHLGPTVGKRDPPWIRIDRDRRLPYFCLCVGKMTIVFSSAALYHDRPGHAFLGQITLFCILPNSFINFYCRVEPLLPALMRVNACNTLLSTRSDHPTRIHTGSHNPRSHPFLQSAS